MTRLSKHITWLVLEKCRIQNTKTNFHVERIQIIWCSYPIHLRWLDHSVVYLHVSPLFKSPLLWYYRFQCEPPGHSSPLRQHSDGSLQWDRYSLRHAVPRSDGTFDQKGGKCLWQLMAPNVTLGTHITFVHEYWLDKDVAILNIYKKLHAFFLMLKQFFFRIQKYKYFWLICVLYLKCL